MAQYRNEKAAVVNVGGQMVAPKNTVELPDKTVGLAGMVKRGTLSKLASRQSAKTEPKQDAKTEAGNTGDNGTGTTNKE